VNETRLRELLDIAVGEPPRSVSVPAVRRLARRRGTLHATTAAAAVAAVAAVSVAVSTLTFGQAAPAASQHPATGVPRYYLQQQELDVTGVSQSRGALVRDTATGAITAVARCPWAGAVISGQIAPTGYEAFFMACLRTSGSGGHEGVVGSRIYRFRVTRAGTIPGYTPVPGGWLPGLAVNDLTAAADGSDLAMTTFRGLLPGTGDLLVINASTGAHAVWRGLFRPQLTPATHLSLSPDGRDLRFVVISRTSGTGHPAVVELAQVSPASRGGLLSSARVLIHVPPTQLLALMSDFRLSPGGSVLTVAELLTTIGPGQPSTGEALVEQISVATGRVIRVLFRASFATTDGFGFSASPDPSGRYIILTYGPSRAKRNGWLDHGRLVPLAPATGAQIGYETW
jgi:hypothetical protein